MKIYREYADGKKEYDLLEPSVLEILPVPELWKYFQSKYSEICNGAIGFSGEVVDSYEGRSVFAEYYQCCLRGYTTRDFKFTDPELTQELFIKRIYDGSRSPRRPEIDTLVTIVHVSQFNSPLDRSNLIKIRREVIPGYVI